MSNEQKTSENDQGHAPLAGVMLSARSKYPNTEGNWRLEQFYHAALENEPRLHISRYKVWRMRGGKYKGEFFAYKEEEGSTPVRCLGRGNWSWVKEH